MKIIFCFLILSFFSTAFAEDYKLSQASATYSVSHLVKTVKGESRELKGKMVCEKSLCDFLVAIPVISFVSSDSNRDLNMQTILEISKYPLITAKGKLNQEDLQKDKFEVKSMVNFHGVEKEYTLKIQKSQTMTGSLTLLLEDHKVERPSLLTVAIKNEVPVDISFNWMK